MGSGENRQCYLTIPNSHGESQTFLITPEVLPDQLIPLIQKKQLPKENNSEELTQKKPQGSETGCTTTLIPLHHFNTLLQNSSNQDNCAKLLVNCDNASGTAVAQASTSPSPPASGDTVVTTTPINLHSLQHNTNFSALSFAPSHGILQHPSGTGISSQNQSSNTSSNTVLIPLSLSGSNQYSPAQQILVAVSNQAGSNNPTIISTPISTSILSSSTITKSQSANTVIKAMDQHQTPLARLITENSTTGNFQHKYEPLSRNSTPLSSSGGSGIAISKATRSSMHTGASGMVTDGSEKKKEIRLLKNREAARECRRKKKEYVSCLENRIRRLEEQNKVLVDEIKRMKELYPPPKSSPHNTQMILPGHDHHNAETTNQNSTANYL